MQDMWCISCLDWTFCTATEKQGLFTSSHPFTSKDIIDYFTRHITNKTFCFINVYKTHLLLNLNH